MKVLITGGAGFIGSHITDKLVNEGYDVTILDNLSGNEGKKPDYLNSRAKFIQGDVRDSRLIDNLVKEHEAIIHNAAAVGIAQSNYELNRFTEVNCLGTANVLQAIINSKTKPRLIIPASNTTYGEGIYSCETHGKFHPKIRTSDSIENYGFEPICTECYKPGKPIPTPERTSLDCNSVYAFTKKFQEENAILLGKMYDFPVIALKYFNVFGPRQSLSNPYTGVSAIFMSRVKAGNIPTIYEDGKQTRDFISVHDVVEANVSALNAKENSFHQGYNIGSGKPITIEDLASEICLLHGREPKFEINNKFRAGDIRHCISDNSLVKKVLNWNPKISFKEGLKEIYEWSKTQESRDDFDKANRELKERGLI